MSVAAEEHCRGCLGQENAGWGRMGRGQGALRQRWSEIKTCNLGRRARDIPAPGSWRDSGIDSGIDLRRHELGPEDPGSALADLRFEIQREEGVKDIAGQEGDQQEALDGVGIVLIDVVGMPAVDQFVEAMILDIPSLVAEADGPFGGDKLDGKRGHPDPVAGLRIVFAVELPAHGMRFQRTDDSHRSIYLRPGKQVRKVPPQTLTDRKEPCRGEKLSEQTGRILIEVALFILEYCEGVFAASQRKLKNGAVAIERIGKDQIERARIRTDHPLQ